MNEYIVFMIAFAASAATPGPEIAGILSRSLSGRMFTSVPLALGIIFGKLLLLTVAVVSLTALVKIVGPMFIVLKYCGAGYLLWLGMKKWKNSGRELAGNENVKILNTLTEIGLGLAMTLSNPIAIVFYMALLPGVIHVSGITWNEYILLCFIIIGVMTIIVIGYSIMAEAVKKLFSSSNSKKHMDRLASTMMVCAALLIITR